MVCFRCFKDLPPDDFYQHPKMKSGRLGKCKECTKSDVQANYRKRKALSPEKYKARTAVGNAIRDGRLLRQPCEKCGYHKSQAHHHDYSKPLDVNWLCFACHRKEHGCEAIPF